MKQVRMYHVELVRESSKLYDIDTNIDSSTKAPEVLRKVLNVEKWHNEKFGFMALDSQNKLIGIHIVSEGTLNETAIYPREIAVRALLNNANTIILFHNHPGESLKPSQSDIIATKSIQKALETLQIKLLDHIILTTENHTSFAEKGLL
jgi:DNA repair protein RadC